MKVTVTRNDGHKIEVEGPAEELAKVLHLLVPTLWNYNSNTYYPPTTIIGPGTVIGDPGPFTIK